MSPQASTLRRPAPIDPRIKARRIEVRRHEGRRRLQRLLDVGLVALVVAGFAVALRSPLLDVDEVAITGARRTPAEAIRGALDVRPGDQLVDLDLGAAAQRVAALPWVGEARLHRGVDGLVSVEVTERVPVAVIAQGELLVDATGRVLGPARGASPAPALVALSGVEGSPAPGEHLSASLEPVLALAARLAAEVPGAVSSLDTGEGLQGTLRSGGLVRFGDASALDAKLRSLATVLAQVDLTCLGVLDLRLPGSPVLTREQGCP